MAFALMEVAEHNFVLYVVTVPLENITELLVVMAAKDFLDVACEKITLIHAGN